MKRFKTVDSFIASQDKWQETLIVLRDILNKTGLEETVKWGMPVYTYKGKNIAGIGSFKEYAGLWFFQGALLKDSHKKLINAQEDTTQAMRQWRIASKEEIDENLIVTYIAEAIQNQKDGKQIKARKNKPLIVPPELTDALHTDAVLEDCFNRLNLTKKREFVEYIATAKRDATKQSRLEKIKPLILEGLGLNDKYR